MNHTEKKPIKNNKKNKLKRKEGWAAFFFLLPSFAGFLLFYVIDFIASVILGFFDWYFIQSPEFVGLSNYIQLLFHDTLFRKVLWNTIYFTIFSVPLSAAVGLIIAVALNQNIKGVVVYRALFFIPYITSLVAISLLWQWIFNDTYGLFNSILTKIGISNPPQWLSSTNWAMPAIIIMSVWANFGLSMILFLAGLQNIPKDLYEAASLDGASKFKKFLYITFPSLTPTTFFVIVISTINSFQVFSQALIMTKGGPNDATNTVVYYIYQNGFEYFKMGYASAVAMIMFVIIFIITLLQMILQKKWVHY